MGSVVAWILLVSVSSLSSADKRSSRRDTSDYIIGDSVQPLVVLGDGWMQQFTFINVDYYQGGETTLGTLSFYTEKGQPWKLPLKGRGLTDRIEILLHPEEMLMLETDVSWSTLQIGWAYFDVSATGNYHAFSVYRKQAEGRPDFMTSVPFVDGLEDEWIIPFDNDGWKYPGIALVNTSSYQTTTFTLSVVDVNGNVLKTISKPVNPRCLHWFSLVHENTDLTLKRGQIKVKGGLFSSAVLTLQFAPNGAFTALPVVHAYGMP